MICATPGVYIPSTANIIRFATRKNNNDENENNEKETNNKNNKKRTQSKISEYTKRNETNMMMDLPIPQIISIPTGKRQRKNEVSSDSIVDGKNKKVIQEDTPLESETRELQQPDKNGNDDTGNEIIKSSGGIKESYEMRFPTKKSTYRLRKRRRVTTYVESVCSEDTKNSMDSDFET